MGKVVLLDILGQMVQKLGSILQWRPSWQPSWISQLAQGDMLDIRLILIIEVLMM